MNKFLDLRLRRFVPVGLIAMAAAVLLAPAPARATAFVLKMTQQGSSVVATGSGEFDLSGLSTNPLDVYPSSVYVNPWLGYIATGSASGYVQAWVGTIGPFSFGPSSAPATFASTGTGDPVAIWGYNGLSGILYLPQGYVSGNALADSATWDSASFASLGVTPGTYVWSWGSAADQSFTLIISGGTMKVPEPAALGTFGLGLVLIGGFVGLRRRVG